VKSKYTVQRCGIKDRNEENEERIVSGAVRRANRIEYGVDPGGKRQR